MYITRSRTLVFVMYVRPFAALGSIFLLGYDPQYRPPMGEKWRAALGSIRSGVYKNIDPRLFL